MANPTTNYGWVMPTATDLVTDLPADFNTFGQGVDTSMAQLLGGTTGQILSKTSATSMAFTWTTPNPGDITGVTAGTGISGGGTSGDVTVTNSMATAITTAGDLIKGTGSGTFNRLGIGSTGQVLTVASGAPSWATPSAGALTLITTATAANTATTLSINNCFSATYDSYLIISNMKASAEDDYRLRLRVSGTDTTASYFMSGLTTFSNSSTISSITGNNVGFYGLRDIGTTRGIATINMANPFATSETSLSMVGTQGVTAGASEGMFNGGSLSNSTSYDGFTVFAGGGAATLTGTIKVYGYSN